MCERRNIPAATQQSLNLLLGFEHATPNNTLPLLYAESAQGTPAQAPNMISASEPFLKVRADDFSPESVYNEFIVPPFKNWINVMRHPRSVRIMGGRGCGKTMFVRYFGHPRLR